MNQRFRSRPRCPALASLSGAEVPHNEEAKKQTGTSVSAISPCTRSLARVEKHVKAKMAYLPRCRLPWAKGRGHSTREPSGAMGDRRKPAPIRPESLLVSWGTGGIPPPFDQGAFLGQRAQNLASLSRGPDGRGTEWSTREPSLWEKAQNILQACLGTNCKHCVSKSQERIQSRCDLPQTGIPRRGPRRTLRLKHD